MTKLIKALAIVFITASLSSAQDEQPKTGFEFLKRFEGKWKVVSMAPGQTTPAAEGTFEARAMGSNWLVCEQNAVMGSVSFNAIQRIGYDSKTKRYTGSWFDNMMKHVWKYDGVLDATGNQLTLNAEGPDWTNPASTKDYRDIYKFESDSKISTKSQMKNEDGSWQTFMTGTFTKEDSSVEASAKTTVTPFLMFTGKAEEAIEYYGEVFPGLEVLSMEKHGKAGSGKEGTIKMADISIAGQRIRLIDSPPVHDFDFTPSFSFFVECENESQLKERFEKLSDGGKVMMPVNSYEFSKKFGWTSDKFGVSWQLNLK